MNIGKVARIAAREFVSTAVTKGFIFGAIAVPAVIAAIMPLVVMLVNRAKPPADRGEVVLIDRSGDVAQLIADRLEPATILQRSAERSAELAARAADVMNSGSTDIADIAKQAGNTGEESLLALYSSAGIPQLRVTPMPPDSNIDEQKARLREQIGRPVERGADKGLLAIAVVDNNAVRRSEGEPDFGAYELFTVPKLDDRTVGEIRDAITWSIREKRFEAAGLDRSEISRLSDVSAPRTQEVTLTGTRDSSFGLNMLLPAGFMILMLMGVFTGGQYLLTTTIEEKSSRVVEVLLSAVSPRELMTGKVLGQMGVGLSLLIVYNGLGIVALFVFNRADLIAASTIAWMLVFFAIAYFMVASMMAAAGAAVNDLREAQSLITPFMLVMMLPYIFFLPVVRDPNSTLSTVSSMIPPISPFIMIMRVASSEPPPLWQVIASIAIGVVACYVCVWIAAKVFRVGLLMYGKPPNFQTLVRWIRMA